MTNAEAQLEDLFAKYEDAVATLGRALRTKLRARLPGLCEIVYRYENQDALVISYSPSERGADGVCALGLYPDGVKLFFTHGARLAKSDPDKLLQGRGKTVRHVMMTSIADFDRAEIEMWIAAALQLANVQLDASARGPLVFRIAEQQQRAKTRATSNQRARPRD